MRIFTNPKHAIAGLHYICAFVHCAVIVHAHKHTHTLTYIHTLTHTHIHTHTHTHTSTHTHPHTLTHTNTPHTSCQGTRFVPLHTLPYFSSRHFFACLSPLPHNVERSCVMPLPGNWVPLLLLLSKTSATCLLSWTLITKSWLLPRSSLPPSR